MLEYRVKCLNWLETGLARSTTLDNETEICQSNHLHFKNRYFLFPFVFYTVFTQAVVHVHT